MTRETISAGPVTFEADVWDGKVSLAEGIVVGDPVEVAHLLDSDPADGRP